MIKIRCVVERITYQNPENGYSVLKCAVKNYNDLVTVVGKSGPKARTRVVVDGQQVEIPVLHMDRTVGTQKESVSREWKDRSKRRRCMIGKSVIQTKGVMGSEIKVAKHVSWLPRKAAIVPYVPVP